MFALVELRALTMPSVNGRVGSGDVICFPLLNDRNQSLADKQRGLSISSVVLSE
jgi:hypothetical protein